MARIVKEADERKNEILDAAERLFTVKGYGKTTILDILEQVGIAKGTFYYYFKSKEEVMDAIIERFIEQDVQKARQIALDKGLTPVQKFCGIIAAQQPRTDGPKDRGFTAATIVITWFRGSPMAAAYRGRVMKALQKQANRVRIGTLTTMDAMAARRVFPPLL